jgi:hypothetical protein
MITHPAGLQDGFRGVIRERIWSKLARFTNSSTASPKIVSGSRTLKVKPPRNPGGVLLSPEERQTGSPALRNDE